MANGRWQNAREPRALDTRRTSQKRPALAGSTFLTASAAVAGGGGAVGVTLLGLTSVLPTKVTPSSMTSFGERMSPNNSVLDLISIFSRAMTKLVIEEGVTFVGKTEVNP